MVEAIWIENLLKVLDYEEKLYKQLLIMAESKTSIVVKGELENLQATVSKEQKTVHELNKLKDIREQIIGQIAKSIGRKSEALTVGDLLPILSESDAQRLSKARERLRTVVDQLTEKNNLNQKLIQNALDYVDFSLNLLTQPAPQAPQYGRKGNETGTHSRGVFDIKY